MKIPWSLLGQLGSLILIWLAACTAPHLDPSIPTQVEVSPSPMANDYLAPSPKDDAISRIPTSITPSTSPATTTQYFLDVVLDYDQKKLEITQTIIYTNDTNDALNELLLIVPPAYKKEVFFLNSINTSQTQHDSRSKIKDALIHLQLETPLEMGQQIEVNLDYQLSPPRGAQALGYTNRQLLLADWYPMIPPYHEDVGWVINPPWRVGEHLVYPLSDFHLNLCLFTTTEGLVVAASAPLANTQENCYRYEQAQSRNITLAVSPDYQVSTIEDDLVTIITYTFPEHVELGWRSAALAVQAWGTFTELFGENQREFLSIVEADIFDGLETDGLIYLSEWYYQTADPSPQNYFELLIVHETAHQWFYGYVHNDQAREPWLDEALATYCEILFYEIHHPELVNWWWYFRVADYAPKGPVNADIYSFRQYRPYIDAVYLRGAYFLQALRDEVGDPAFFEGLRKYVQSSDPEAIQTAADFFNTFSQVSDAELSKIIIEYFQ
jgi:hypothetical protein